MKLPKVAILTLGAAALALALNRTDGPEGLEQARKCIPADQSLLERHSLGLPEPLPVPQMGGLLA